MKHARIGTLRHGRGHRQRERERARERAARIDRERRQREAIARLHSGQRRFGGTTIIWGHR